MGKTVIPDVEINKLATSLEQCFAGEKVYFSQAVLHIKASREKMMGWIAETKENASPMLWDYNVLIEYQTADNNIKFLMHGKDFVCTKLTEQYGGRISGCKYWLLYNEPITKYNHGYKKKLPSAEEIIRCIEELY